MNKPKIILSIIIFHLSFLTSHAQLKLAALFADSMVLQQNTDVAIWGWGEGGDKITISNAWNKSTAATEVDKNGKWLMKFRTQAAGGPYDIVIQGKKERIVLHGVLLGEVWLCSGQSNMEWPLERAMNGKEEIDRADFPRLRMFTVIRNTSTVPLKDLNGSWKVCSPSNAGKFSAVAYYFGKEIMKQTGIPVGLIHSSWGGTPAEAWMSKESLEAEPDFKPIFERYNKAIDDYAMGTSAYDEQFKKWLVDSANAKQRGDTIPSAPKKPAAVRYYQSPANLYNAMIAPLVPYTIRGVIWYQGESNAGRAYQYRKLFPGLINGWRKDWNAELPFYFVQIAPHQGQSPEIREAQLFTMKTVPKTGMAVITDVGDSLDIHPRNKEIPGHRLALWALAKEYGKKDLTNSGPVYKSMKRKGNKIKLEFDYVDGGLVAKDNVLTEFSIAGSDKKFVPAHARIDGKKVVVWSDAIKDPVAVRFGWKNVPHPELYNKAGLPASPFRTDDWPGETVGKN